MSPAGPDARNDHTAGNGKRSGPPLRRIRAVNG